MATKPIFLDNPTDEQAGKFKGFFTERGIELNLAETADSASVVVSWPGEKMICEPARMHSGGRVDCVTAFKLATNAGLDRPVFGELLNELEIKVRDCQIGCF